MFETVVPETFTKRSRAVFYETLPLSVGLHIVVIVGVVVAAAWNISWPLQSPKTMRPYVLIETPTPPPPPPPPAPPKQVTQQQVTTTPMQKLPDVAPVIIPDTIPLVQNELPKPLSIVVVMNPVPGGVEGGIEGGIAGGSLDGVKGGEVGGVKNGVIGGIIDDGRVHIGRDKPLPLYPVSQVYPIYPEEMRLRHYEDSLVVRYLIGKDGRVKEVTVLNHPERAVFEKVAVGAIRNWRFRPFVQDGQVKEVEHELTVNFKLDT